MREAGQALGSTTPMLPNSRFPGHRRLRGPHLWLCVQQGPAGQDPRPTRFAVGPQTAVNAGLEGSCEVAGEGQGRGLTGPHVRKTGTLPTTALGTGGGSSWHGHSSPESLGGPRLPVSPHPAPEKLKLLGARSPTPLSPRVDVGGEASRCVMTHGCVGAPGVPALDPGLDSQERRGKSTR